MAKGTVLTEQLRQQIEAMAADMSKPAAGKIARKLQLKHGTVYWFMLTRGLLDKKSNGYGMRGYLRNGKQVNPYSPEHDRRMLSLRVDGKSPSFIAALLTDEFGIPRNQHSVRNRLIMLAAQDEAA